MAMKFIGQIFSLFFILLVGIVRSQEIPLMQDDVEFVNVDPHYARSLRLEFGFIDPIQNDKLNHFFSGMYCARLGYVFNIKKKYLLGAYVGHFAIQNTLNDSALYTKIKEQVRNNNYVFGAQAGYEFYTTEKSILSFLANGGYTAMTFSRKKALNEETIARYEKQALNIGFTASWTYFIEEKYTCGAFLSYQWYNYTYEPALLGYAPDHKAAKTQLISLGLAFNFGAGE